MQYVFVCLCHPSADVWGEGNLPPGWREISDSSEIYFWHIPTGTTQYHRPVASGDEHTSPSKGPDTEHDTQQGARDSLNPPNEVRGAPGVTTLSTHFISLLTRNRTHTPGSCFTPMYLMFRAITHCFTKLNVWMNG